MLLAAIKISSETLDTIADTGATIQADIEEMKEIAYGPTRVAYYFIPNVVDPERFRRGCWAIVPEDTFTAVYDYDASKIHTQFVEITRK